MEQKANIGTDLLMPTVEQYICNEYRAGTLQELAHQTGYSASALSRLIKKETGLTFKELQTRQRMKRVLCLLRDTGRPIREIAVSVGYENSSYFYKQFEREFGMRPKEARQKLQGYTS